MPQDMLANSYVPPYFVAEVPASSVPVAPFPPPPPSPNIGTVAGPPAPSNLPSLTDVSGADSCFQGVGCRV